MNKTVPVIVTAKPEIMEIDGHELTHDSRQFILSHPAGCPHRGSPVDRGATFIGYWVLEESLAECGLKPHAPLFERISAIVEAHRKTRCRNRRS